MARRPTYRRATQCRHCQQMTATYFAQAGDARVWYLCANPACRKLHEGPAPEPVGGGR